MWFIGVEVEQETSAPPPKKILDPPLIIIIIIINFIYSSLLTSGQFNKTFTSVAIVFRV